MKKIFSLITTSWFWLSLSLFSALLFPVALLIFITTFAFDKRRICVHYFSCFWSVVILTVNPIWRVKIEGKNNIEKGTRYIMVANHSSGADILVLYKLFLPFKWVAKKSLFYTPFLGWNMWLNGYIPIERSRGRSKLLMMDKAVKAVNSGNSVMIFPEGTRTRDGKIQNFMTGSFRLASETKTAILPIAVKGTFSAIKKGGIMIHKNFGIKTIVMEPIPYERFRNMDHKEVAVMVHDLIRDRLESEQ